MKFSGDFVKKSDGDTLQMGETNASPICVMNTNLLKTIRILNAAIFVISKT